MPLVAGARIGAYEIIASLGAGGMGEVYRARDPKLNRDIALKILLGRGKVLFAPWGLHFDAYRNKLVRTWRPGGNRNPLQRLALHIARKQLGDASRSARDS